MDGYQWSEDIDTVDWDELSNLYRIAPLGEKPPEILRAVFTRSMIRCFVRSDDTLVGAGRALADGHDCAYVADIAVHPGHQGQGLGSEIVRRIVARAEGHKKVILYANPGTEPFYARFGFLPMNTAMAIWNDPSAAIASGLLRELD